MSSARLPPQPRLLIGLYLVAGMPLGVIADLVPVYLRQEGLRLGDIGLFSALHLFYGLKVVWGPLIDRAGLARRWLLATAVALAGAYACLGHLQPHDHVAAFAAACLVMVWASSVYDVAVDATFVRSLGGALPAVEARANAWRLSSFKLAMVVVGNGCAVIGGWYGFRAVFYGLLAAHLTLLACIPWRALSEVVQAPMPWGLYLAGLWRWARAPQQLHAFALIFCYKLAIAALLGFERTWWVDRGITLAQLGLVGAAVSLGSTVAGASFGSLLAHRRGIASMLRWGIWVQAATAALYLLLARLPVSMGALGAGLAASGCCFGLSTAALMSFITRLCRAPHAATQFAALTGTYALTRSVAGVCGGMLAQRFGYDALFASIIVLCVPALLLLPRQTAAHRRRRLDAGPPGGAW